MQEADFIEHLFAAQNHDYLMFFTNTGRVYVDRVYEIDEAARSAQGRNIKNLLDLQPEEAIAAILRLERRVDEKGNDITFAEGSGNVVFATKDGTVKKTSLNDFVNYRKAGIIAINLEEGNTLVNAELTTGENEIVLVTHDGMSIRFPEEALRTQGRNTIGVRGIRPRARGLRRGPGPLWTRRKPCWWPLKTASASAPPLTNTARRAAAAPASRP